MVTCHTSLRRFAQCGSLLAWVCLPTEDHLDTEEYWDSTFHRRDVALENVHISYTHTVIEHRQTNHRELPGFLDWQDYSRFCFQCNNCVRITRQYEYDNLCFWLLHHQGHPRWMLISGVNGDFKAFWTCWAFNNVNEQTKTLKGLLLWHVSFYFTIS